MPLNITEEEKLERRKEQQRVSKRKWYINNTDESKKRVKEWQMCDPEKQQN